ncbi:MAG TPA: dihydroneopterin aldolase [Beijerinckiaceae bacterium]|jgi:dihydroneopterin aldolase|nr:dihydroneopterin aldolase [Beijerinckiaceae bacterium]
MKERFSLEDHLAVALDDVVVNVRCGLHPWERHPEYPNRLSISVKLYAHLHARHAADMPIIDYDRIRNHILRLEKADHIDLLETIVDGLCEECFVDPRVEACSVSVRKLDIFNETRSAGIDVFRTRERWFGGP